MNRRTYLATASSAVVVGVTGCFSDDPDGGNGDSDEQPVVLSNIEQKTDAETMYYLTGEAENVSDSTQEFQVRVDWFDADDNLLGETFSQVEAEIEAGQTRAWDTTYYDSEDSGEPEDYEVEVHIY